MTLRPTVPAVAEKWYRELAVSQPSDDQRGWPLLKVLGALGTAFGRLHDLVSDGPNGPGWTMLLDPERTDARDLPWLAQFAGVGRQVAAATSEAQQRALITSPPAFWRGTRHGIIAAVAPTLTGARHVSIIEQAGGDPYALTVKVYASECPFPAVSHAAAESQTPFWLRLTFVLGDSPLIDEATRFGDDATAVGDLATLSDVT